ncbi:hypothetical protein AA313_de0201187 [Arthrobotrys entomopaga]|nr:hypothetical protein AA313_de0201187 [Arthrobotrys entomopaga]
MGYGLNDPWLNSVLGLVDLSFLDDIHNISHNNTICPTCQQEIKLGGNRRKSIFRLPPGIPWSVHAYADISSEQALRDIYTNLILVTSTTQTLLPYAYGFPPLGIVYPPEISESHLGSRVHGSSRLVEGSTTTYGSTTVVWKPSCYKSYSSDRISYHSISSDLAGAETQTAIDKSGDLSASLESMPDFDEFMTWLDMNEVLDEEIADQQDDDSQELPTLSESTHGFDRATAPLNTEEPQADPRSEQNTFAFSEIPTSGYKAWLRLLNQVWLDPVRLLDEISERETSTY